MKPTSKTCNYNSNLATIATELASSNIYIQKQFLKKFFGILPYNQRLFLYEYLFPIVYPNQEYEKLIRWMEQRFAKDISRTPAQIAAMALNYTKTDYKMKPLYIKLARRAKDRVRKRLKSSNKMPFS